jgi:hypothetical protein
VDEAVLEDCHRHLGELFARNTLVSMLKSQQSEGTWLANPGRGRRLGLQVSHIILR